MWKFTAAVKNLRQFPTFSNFLPTDIFELKMILLCIFVTLVYCCDSIVDKAECETSCVEYWYTCATNCDQDNECLSICAREQAACENGKYINIAIISNLHHDNTVGLCNQRNQGEQ